jgi:hypothetical protein
MAFFKSVAKWASIWAAVAVVFLVIQDLRDGKAIDPEQVISGAIVIWIVMAGLITVAKVRRAARQAGSTLGRAAFAATKERASTPRPAPRSGTLPQATARQPGGTPSTR